MEKSDLPTRWVVLFLTSFIMMGAYFCYDNPAALKEPIQKAMNLTEYQFNLLYSVYSLPNIILPLFGGLLIDRMGTRLSLISFMVCIVLGQGWFALGVSVRDFGSTLWGRAIFGLGGESICVLQSTILASWFKGKEIALAMGWSLTVARLGSVINDWACPEIYNNAFNIPFLPKGDPSSAIWVGFLVTVVAFMSSILLIHIEDRSEQFLRESKSSVISVIDANTPLIDECTTGEVVMTETEATKISLSNIRKFSLSFWLLTISCVVIYATVLPFNNVAVSVIKWKTGTDVLVAARLMSIPFFMSACINPFLGGLVDLVGLRAIMVFNGSVAVLAVHLMFSFLPLNTVMEVAVPLLILGFAYSLYAAAMWPSIPLVVEESVLGLAYGLITAVQNGGLFAMPIVVGYIHDVFHGYKAVELFFAGVALVGVFVGVILNIVDQRNGSPLNGVVRDREEDREELLIAA